MIPVDTSVVIDYLRTADPKLVGLFNVHGAAVCGATRAEVLNGRRDPAHRARMLAALNSFHQVPRPDALWDDVGDNLGTLRTSGVTVPFPDVVIATVAIANDIELWTRDNQFLHIQRVLARLRLFVEPP
jgi:predicted nucleic acid-binding protein